MNQKYIVDISKPPIFPPERYFNESFLLGARETQRSIAQTEEWREYIKKYEDELEKSRRSKKENMKTDKANYWYIVYEDKAPIACFIDQRELLRYFDSRQDRGVGLCVTAKKLILPML